jgi:hypothetical protein
MKRKPKPCELYRHFDSEGRLLYVGISWCSLERLMNGHRSTANWFPQITRVEIERFPSRAEAMAAENRAIEAEGPLYNIATETRRGLACLSDEVKAERARLIARAEPAGVKVRSNACLEALKRTVLAAERGDYDDARNSTAYLGLTRRISTNAPQMADTSEASR